MLLIRTPSKAMIDALGWEAIQEIEAWFDDAAEDLRAERRRLELARLDAARPVRGEADVLSRLADTEYELRLEMVQARARLERKLEELTREIRRLGGALEPSLRNEER